MQAIVVVLGPPCPVVHEATQAGAPLAGCPALALRQVPRDVRAIADMDVPASFRLAWIFTDESALGSDELRACQQRLGSIAPVTIALHHAQGNPTQGGTGLSFPGGVILQPYTDATFPLVVSMITDFVARGVAETPGS